MKARRKLLPGECQLNESIERMSITDMKAIQWKLLSEGSRLNNSTERRSIAE